MKRWFRRSALPSSSDTSQSSRDVLLEALTEPFEDPQVDEVLVNGLDCALAVTPEGTRSFALPVPSLEAWCDWLIDFAALHGSRLDPLHAIAGGRLCAFEGRWHAVLPPVAPDGPLLSLRRHRFERLSLADFACSTSALAHLSALVASGVPLLIAGPTGAGKTSFLVCLLREWAAQERIVLVESLAELPRALPSWIRLVASPPRLDGKGKIACERLIAEALRLRPDRLVVGEIRGSEARAWLEAVASGHRGAVATIHAGSPAEAAQRLQALAGRRQGLFQGGVRMAVAMMARGRPPRLEKVELIEGCL